MVSRNAGWNMCELEGKWFPQALEPETRKQLFLTYERANWLIFQDAYPQLLLYDYSTKLNTPMFHSLLFAFQDYLHFSAVLFPTHHGELYGASVYGFQDVDNRIDLGRRLADILFNPDVFSKVFHFAKTTAHTGSRYDYEQFMKNKEETTPFLKETYPVIKHHIHLPNEWTKHPSVKNKWFRTEIIHRHPWEMTHWYSNNQKQIRFFIMCYNLLQMKNRI